MNYQETSRRYAKALLSIAQEKGHLDSVIAQMEQISQQMQKDQELYQFMTSPISKVQSQKDILKKFFENQPLREEIQGLLFLLAEKKRFFLLQQICQSLQKQVDAVHGVVRGVASSSMQLDKTEQEKLIDAVSRFTGKKVQMDFKIDSALIGGVVARVGSYVFDDSLETQLKMMKDDLTVKEY